MIGFGFSVFTQAILGAGGFAKGSSLALDFTSGNRRLDPRITFSRTTNATVTGSNGLIQNAPMNLLTFSESFDNAVWAKLNSTVTANAATAPDGTTTADRFISAGGAYPQVFQDKSIAAGTYTASIYVKADGTSQIEQVLILDGTSVSFTPTTTWTRVSVTKSGITAGTKSVVIATNSGAAPVSSFYIWGAQLELGSTATTYNPTTVKNLLGFTEHFDNAAWTKSNAFVQTNQLLWSQDFTNAAWTKVGATVASSANTISFPNLNEAISQAATMSATVGTAATFSVVLSGSGTVYIGCFRAGAGAYEEDRTLITLTSTPTRYTVSHTMVNASQTGFGGFISRGADGTATTVTATQAQLVNGTSAGDYKATYAAAAAVGYTDIYGQPFAQKLVEETSSNAHRIFGPTVTPVSGTPYAFSFYAKAAERRYAYIRLNNSGGDFVSGTVDLLDGTVTQTLTGTITAVATGSGWFRICGAGTAPSAATTTPEIRTANSATYANYTGDGTSGIYIFGAQLSDSASVDPYVYQPVAAPTSTAYYGPRFDYDPVTLAPKGLLIEEQRTNLLTYSEQFDNAAWGKSASTVTANAIVSPDGTLDADKLVEDASTGSHYAQVTPTVVSGTAYAFSVYAKAGERNLVSMLMAQSTSPFTNHALVEFNLSTGAISTTTVGSGTITPAGNGWYRCTVFGTASSTGEICRITYATTGNGTSGLYIWGAQLEAGAFATSYIPTVASQVTRAADSASMIGNNFARWFNQTAGTLYSESLFNGNTASLQRLGISVSDGTTSNRITSVISSGTAIRNIISVGGVAQADMSSTVASTFNTSIKNAVAYAANDFATTANGVTPQTDTSGSVPVVNQAWFGQSEAGGNTLMLNGTIKRIAYYPRRLANTELQGITA